MIKQSSESLTLAKLSPKDNTCKEQYENTLYPPPYKRLVWIIATPTLKQ